MKPNPSLVDAAAAREANAPDSDALNEELLRLRQDTSDNYWAATYKNYAEDRQFIANADAQWNPDVRDQRMQADKPALTINKIPKYINYINSQIQNSRVSLRVKPIDTRDEITLGAIDYPISQMYNSILSDIERQSKWALSVKKSAHQFSGGGLSFLGWDIEPHTYLPEHFEIRVKSYDNPTGIGIDPCIDTADFSEANYAFQKTHSTQEGLVETWGKAAAEEIMRIDTGARMRSHHGEVTYEICRYFYRKNLDRNIAMFPNGRIVLLPENIAHAQDYIARMVARAGQEGEPPPMVRQTKVPAVFSCLIHEGRPLQKIVGSSLAEPVRWPIGRIPLIPVCREAELDSTGADKRLSAVHWLKDPQRQTNYVISVAIEMLGNAARLKTMLGVSQITAEFQQDLADPSKKYVAYNDMTNQAPPAMTFPQNFPQSVHPIIQMLGEAQDESTGIYNEAVGDADKHLSGVAARSFQQASQSNTNEFTLVFTEAVRELVSQITEAIPSVYNQPQVRRVSTLRGEAANITLNEPYMAMDGKTYHLNDLNIARYDVVASPEYLHTNMHAEQMAHLMDMLKTTPEAAQVVAPYIFEMFGGELPAEIADVMRRALPPHLLTDAQKARLGEQKREPTFQEQTDRMQAEANVASAQAQAKTALAQTQKAQLQVVGEALKISKNPDKPETPEAKKATKVTLEALVDEIARLSMDKHRLEQQTQQPQMEQTP